MAYATINDMVERFGQIELIRLSTRDGVLPEAIDGARVAELLEDASSVIDSHLRRRYATPLNPAPREIRRACCILARYDLAQGGDQTPSEAMETERSQIMKWLRELAEGNARLDLGPAPTDTSARVSDRPREFTGLGLP